MTDMNWIFYLYFHTTPPEGKSEMFIFEHQWIVPHITDSLTVIAVTSVDY